jgi:hypothetical protein
VFGASTLVVVDLVTGQRSLLDVGDNPTDLDLTPDGTKAIGRARLERNLDLRRERSTRGAPTSSRCPRPSPLAR